jgi:hypothetical protein
VLQELAVAETRQRTRAEEAIDLPQNNSTLGTRHHEALQCVSSHLTYCTQSQNQSRIFR